MPPACAASVSTSLCTCASVAARPCAAASCAMIVSRIRLRNTLARTVVVIAVLFDGPPACPMATSVLCSLMANAACVISCAPTFATGDAACSAAGVPPHAATSTTAQSNGNRAHTHTVQRVYPPAPLDRLHLRTGLARNRHRARLSHTAAERWGDGHTDRDDADHDCAHADGVEEADRTRDQSIRDGAQRLQTREDGRVDAEQPPAQ